MFTGKQARNLLKGDATPQSDRELLRLTLSGSMPNSARLWHLHRELFEQGGPPAELPTGWEQRVERRSGRVFYINHNDRTTCWADPRKAVEQHADDEAVEVDEEEHGAGDASGDGKGSGGGSEEEEWDTDGGDDDELCLGSAPASAIDSRSCSAAENAPSATIARTPPPVALPLVEPAMSGGATADEDDEDVTAAQGGSGAVGARVADASAAGAAVASDGSEGADIEGAAAAPSPAPAAALPIVGHCAPDHAPRAELQLLCCGILQPSNERLLRRAMLQHEAAREAVQARLPEAAADGGSVLRGYSLLQQRRLRLLQRVHLALLRERERAALPPRRWEAYYLQQRSERNAKRGARSSKTVSRALDSLSRHSVPSLVTSYTKWFQTRSHLARCNVVLTTLKPLQLYEHPTLLTFESDLERLQQKLVELAVSAADAASGREADESHTALSTGALPTPAPPSPMMLSAAISPRHAGPSPYPSPFMAARGSVASSIASRPTSLSSISVSEADFAPSSGRSTFEALRALLRIALVKGTLPDHLKALRALLATSGCGEPSASPKSLTRFRAAELPPVIEAVVGLRELESACGAMLLQRGLVFCTSAALGNLTSHATLGIHPRSDAGPRAALLASGCLEASAAASILSALIAQAAASTVWGVGPWDHDFASLLNDPPPDEIASAVALAAVEQAEGSDTDSPPDLQISVPLCVDASPQTIYLLLRTLVDALSEVVTLDSLQSTADCAITYTCLALLRLLKVHLHYICTTRIAFADLGLDIEAPLPKDATAPDATAREAAEPSEPHVASSSADRAFSADGGAPGAPAAADDVAADDAASASAPAAEESAAAAAAMATATAMAAATGVAGGTARGGAEAEACAVTPAGAEPSASEAPAAERPSAEAASRSEGAGADADEAPSAEKGGTQWAGLSPDLLRRTRRLLLRVSTCGLSLTDPVDGTLVGEHTTSEAIAVLQVGRRVFFPSAAVRRNLLLHLLSESPPLMRGGMEHVFGSEGDLEAVVDTATSESALLDLEVASAAPPLLAMEGPRGLATRPGRPEAPPALGLSVVPPASAPPAAPVGRRAEADDGMVPSPPATHSPLQAEAATPPPAERSVPQVILADVLMVSFSQESGVEQLVAPSVGSEPTELTDGMALLHRLIREVVAQEALGAQGLGPETPLNSSRTKERAASGEAGGGSLQEASRRRAGRSPLLTLISSIFWGLLSQVPLCLSVDEPAAQALLRCIALLMSGATELLQHPGAAAGGALDAPADLMSDCHLRHSLIGMLPMMAAGLTLLSSFNSPFALQLLPSIPPLLSHLHRAAPCDDSDLTADHLEDFHLSAEAKLFESQHPYRPVHSRDGGGAAIKVELEAKAQAHSSCLWLSFDRRCATVEGEAWLELHVDGKLLYTFGGPSSRWPRRPVVIPTSKVLFRLRFSGAPLGSKRPAARGFGARWGFACRVHSYEPMLTPSIPLLVDCQKSLSTLGAKYASILLIGEPLSPEERAHAEELEGLEPDEHVDGPEGWGSCRLPAALRGALFEKRQRRATSRGTGLELFMQLLAAATSPTVQRHVLLQLAQALKTLQTDDNATLRRCQFLHGCRGCTAAAWAALEERTVRLFSIVAGRLTSALTSLPRARARKPRRDPPSAAPASAPVDATAAAAPATAMADGATASARHFGHVDRSWRAERTTTRVLAGSVAESQGMSEQAVVRRASPEDSVLEAAEESLLVLINVFLVRFQRGDLALLDAAGLLPMLRRLHAARGATRVVCRRVFRQLLLFSFAHRSPGRALTSFQIGLLGTMREEVAAGLVTGTASERDTVGGGAGSLIDSGSVLSLLHSLSASTSVCAHLGSTWMPMLLQLLLDSETSVGASVLRLLRVILAALPPDSAACEEAIREVSPMAVKAHEALGDPEAPLILPFLLEAIGREVGGDTPSVVLCCAGVAAEGAPPHDGVQSPAAADGPATGMPSRVRVRRQGTCSGPVVNELVSLVRHLHRSGGHAWAQRVGCTLETSARLAPSLVEQVSTPDLGAATLSAEGSWLVLGALCVLGGHIDSIHPGSRVLCRFEGLRGPPAAVFHAGRQTAVILADSAHVSAQRAEVEELQPVPEIETGIEGIDLADLMLSLGSLLFDQPVSRAPLPQLGMATCERLPVLAMMQSRACKVIQVLLSRGDARSAATALLSVGLLPQMVSMATSTLPCYQLMRSAAARTQAASTEHLALHLDAVLVEAAPSGLDLRAALPGGADVQPALRQAVLLPSELGRDDLLIELGGLGLPHTAGAELAALDGCHGDVVAAAHRLVHVGSAASGANEAERQATALVASLEAMGFPAPLCAYALRRVGNDLQRAADWLLEGGTMPEGSGGGSGGGGSDSGGSGGGSSGGGGSGRGGSGGGVAGDSSAAMASDPGGSSAFGGSLQAGSLVEISDEADPTQWHKGEVIESGEHAVHVALLGWCVEWAEWVARSSGRLRAPPADAPAGERQLSAEQLAEDIEADRRHTGSIYPSSSPNAAREPTREASSSAESLPRAGVAPASSSSGAAASASSATASASATISASAPALARPSVRTGGWLWRSGGASAKRRTAAEATSGAASPTSAADFFSSDVGLSRIVDRCTLTPPAAAEAAEDATLSVEPGVRLRIAAPGAPHDGQVALLVGEALPTAEVGSSSRDAPPEGRCRLLLATERGAVETERLCAELELPQRQLNGAAHALGSRSLAALVRLGCTLHQSLAVLHCRQSVLNLLCETSWLHWADEDEANPFELASLDGMKDAFVRLLKLACVAETSGEEPSTDTLNLVCVCVSNLLTDSNLIDAAPSFASLPETLGEEVVRFLARSATGVQQSESTHPSEVGDRLLTLSCPGVSAMQLHFDARSWLSRGSTLAIFLDAACTQEAFSFDSEDLLATEVLSVPVDCLHIKYHCPQNRDHAWGWKLHALPARWRVGYEVAVAETPFEFGWDLMQLLVEEKPSAFSQPGMLSNVLRYLLYGRAPHKDRACLLLLKALPTMPLDLFPPSVLQSLEQQIAWHDSVLRQATQPLEGTALLPCSSQCMLDFLIEIRAHLHSQGVTPYPSTLSWMSDVAELSSLTKWLLEPSTHQCPRISTRLALRSSQLSGVDPPSFSGWAGPALDAVLVSTIEKVAHSAALNIRPAQLQTVGEQAREASSALAAYSPSELTFRAALLHRFNQLLARHLSLVHTGLPSKAGALDTLGGRICALRAAILLEIKLGALEQALASTASDSEHITVQLNRFKATRQRARAEAERSGAGTLFVQLHTHLSRVKPRALCRPDKAFRVALVGESADDHGGPYRDAFADVCSEMQSDALPLFIRCPNGVHGVGQHRDAFVPNPSAVSAQQIEWFYFVGQLLGLALRQKETQLGLSLPSVVWKQLVSQPLDEADLEAFDSLCRQSLHKLRRIMDEGITASTFSDVIFETFTTQLSDGTDVALLPNGAEIDVTFANRLEFCSAVLQARLHEASAQCDAMRQGLSYLVPQRVLSLFTWDQLELLACGDKDIDLDLLRSKTKYGVGLSPGQRHVRYLWQTLRKFSPEKRSLFLRFVWGRTRLPSTSAEWGDLRFTLHTRHTPNPDAAYPVAHTCFFSLELPAYSSAAICHDRLLYAITNCLEIDIDTTSSARENRERGATAFVDDSDEEGEVDRS